MKIYRLLLLIVISMATLLACSPSTPDLPYKTVSNPQKTDKPTIYEFFSYFCPHCNQLEAGVNKWKNKLPKSLIFQRIPLTLGRVDTRIYSRAYFIGEALKVLDISHQALFNRYHRQKLPLANDAQLEQFFLSLGVSQSDYDQVTEGDFLDNKIEAAEKLAKQLSVVSVPSFVVNGKYLTDLRLAGNEQELFKLLSRLLRKKD